MEENPPKEFEFWKPPKGNYLWCPDCKQRVSSVALPECGHYIFYEFKEWEIQKKPAKYEPEPIGPDRKEKVRFLHSQLMGKK